MRAELQEKIDRYTEQLRAAKKSDIPVLKAEFDLWYANCSAEQKEEMRPYWEENKRQIKEGLKEVRELIAEVQALDEKEAREAFSQT